ncbi:MAG: hypothetical protein P3X24_000775 [bacterium]|nr:hypothetical protein [bacterium]
MESQARTGDWRITTLGTAILQSRFRTLNRPATPFELMDDAVSYYRENFKTLFRISLWTYLIPIIFSLLLLAPILYFDATSSQMSLGSIIVEYLGLLLLLPYLTVAPLLQAAFTTLAFRKLAQGEPITLRSLWETLKPRFWQLIANQLLAGMALGGIVLILGVAAFVMILSMSFATTAIMASTPTLGIALFAVTTIAIAILFLVIAAMATVWFIILPQIIVLETNTDALSAFSRAFELIRPHFKHAVLSYLAFWGVQAVFMLSVQVLAVLILGVLVGVIGIYSDIEQALSRWWLSLNQLYESVTYVTDMFVMPMMYMTSILFYFDLRYRSEGLDIYEALRVDAGD